jgi:multiple sugar transport system permease protein
MTTTATPPPRTAPATATPPEQRKRGQRSGPAYIFLTPWILGVVLLTLAPMAVSLYLSFTDYNLFDPPKWVGLRNYSDMFTADPRYWRSVGTTLLYVVVAVPLKLAIALGVALLLSNTRKAKGFYRSAFYAPSLLGASMAVALVWRALYNDGGTVDELLSSIGIHTGGWVSDPHLAVFVVALLSAWQFGAPMVIFLAGLQQIPADLYEAAALDGAGAVRQFFSVTLPGLRQVMTFVVTVTILASANMFGQSYLLTKGGPGNQTRTAIVYISDQGLSQNNMAAASAMSYVLFVFLAIISIVNFRLQRERSERPAR